MTDVWRLIDSGRCSASYNMALDEAIATFVRRGLPPVLRLYGWEGPSVSLGCFQKASDIDSEYCAAKGIPVVRRPTGGRAILHCEELTYSFSVRTDREPFSKGLLSSYKTIGSAFSLAFRRLGLHADLKNRRERGSVLAGSPLCFQSSSFGEILVLDKKVVGSAQKRWDDGMLQQGSIAYSFDEKELRRVFMMEGNINCREVMAGVKDLIPGLDEDKLKELVASSFEEIFGIRFEFARPSLEESSLARELETEKYLQGGWNFLR